MFEMKQEYMTGIPMIDEEHATLFELASRAFHLLNNEFVSDKYDEIVTLINELKDYTKKHFADEEAYMESIQYKRMFTQKVQHQQFIEKLDELDLKEIEENQEDALKDLFVFLSDWLEKHILENDILIGKE